MPEQQFAIHSSAVGGDYLFMFGFNPLPVNRRSAWARLIECLLQPGQKLKSQLTTACGKGSNAIFSA